MDLGGGARCAGAALGHSFFAQLKAGGHCQMSAAPDLSDTIFQLELGSCPFYLRMVVGASPASTAADERLMAEFLEYEARAGRISGPEMNWIYVCTYSDPRGTQVYSAKGVDMDAAERLAERAVRATAEQTGKMMLASYEARRPYTRRPLDGAELGRLAAAMELLDRMKATGRIGGYALF